MRKMSLILPVAILLLVILGCSEKKNVETERGRLKLVESKYMGSVGGHGYGRGWITYGRQFYFNDKKWSPKDFDLLKNINFCTTSPNEAVEAFRCLRNIYDDGKDSREAVYVIRVAGDEPVWELVMNEDSNKVYGKNDGEWFGDGKQLIFYDHFFNVETGVRRDIKPLPIYPDNFHFRTVSPDLKTIVYQNIGCTDERGNYWRDVNPDPNFLKACEKRDEYYKNKIETVWLIDADTGATEYLELPRAKYPDLFAQQNSPGAFQKNLVWQKDETGRDKLIYPR